MVQEIHMMEAVVTVSSSEGKNKSKRLPKSQNVAEFERSQYFC